MVDQDVVNALKDKTELMPNAPKSLGEIIQEKGIELQHAPEEVQEAPVYESSLDEAMARLRQEADMGEQLLATQPAVVQTQDSITESKVESYDVIREVEITESNPVTTATEIANPVMVQAEATSSMAVVPDLTKIVIVKDKKGGSLYDMNRKKRRESRPTYQVVLPQSRYSTAMTGLSTLEVQSIVSAKGDAYSVTNSLYSLIHSKMADTSIGTVSYNDFLKMTSSLEEDILLFGLYCATYPTITELPLRCDKCEQQFIFKTVNEDILLMDEEDRDEIVKNIQKIVNLNYTSAKEVLANSEVNTVTRILLPESQIIVDVRVPSLFNKLEDVMQKIDEKLYDTRMDSIELSVYVESLFVPYTDEDGYIPVEKYENILDEIHDLTPADFGVLTAAIEEKVSKLKLKFGLSNVECTHCGHKYEEAIELDIRQILFMRHRHSMAKSKQSENTTNS